MNDLVHADPLPAEQQNGQLTAAAAGRWETIETAPRDGTEILIWDGMLNVGVWWRTPVGGKWMTAESARELRHATHWMRVPASPGTVDGVGAEKAGEREYVERVRKAAVTYLKHSREPAPVRVWQQTKQRLTAQTMIALCESWLMQNSNNGNDDGNQH